MWPLRAVVLFALAFGKIKCEGEVSAPWTSAFRHRVLNGLEPTNGEIPYQAAVYTYHGDEKSFCGGSLIAPDWVLTAAHCVVFDVGGGKQETGSVRVLLGAVNRRVNEHGQQKIHASNVIPHSDFRLEEGAHDLALVKLSVPASLDEYVYDINLPTKGQSFVGRHVRLSGWGLDRDVENGGETTDTLRYIDTVVVPNESCSRHYAPGEVTESHICASGARGKSTCTGDSGGPMVVNENGGYTLIGVLSFSHADSCENGYPTVYTRVANYLDWIKTTKAAPYAASWVSRISPL